MSIRPQGSNLAHIAAELILEIAEYLPLSTQAMMLRICKDIFLVVTRLVYRQIVAPKNRAKDMFLTLVTAPSNCRCYSSLVSTLIFAGKGPTDYHITYPLLCDALRVMSRLQFLSITIPEAHTSFFHHLLMRKGIIRHSTSEIGAALRSLGPKGEPFNLNILPSLRTLKIQGSHKLVSIALHRPIQELEICSPVNLSDTDDLIKTLEESEKGNGLSIIKLNITTTSTGDILLVFYALGRVCPNLKEIGLRVFSFNALRVSECFSVHRNLFVRLRKLTINSHVNKSPLFVTFKSASLKIQHDHVTSAWMTRPVLDQMAFGGIEWIRDDLYSGWRYVENFEGTFKEEKEYSKHMLSTVACYYKVASPLDEDSFTN